MMRRYNPSTQTWTNSYYVQDAQGHTRMLLDATGGIQSLYTYDAWGNPLVPNDDANPLRWNGKFGYTYIPLTGLYHVGAREYDPRTARWLQRDPIHAASGDPNVYRYCGSDPVDYADPDGLDWVDFIPVVGSVRDIYQGVRDGDWLQAGMGFGGLVLDVSTFGTGTVVKGGAKSIARVTAQTLKETASEGTELTTKALVTPKKRQSITLRPTNIVNGHHALRHCSTSVV